MWTTTYNGCDDNKERSSTYLSQKNRNWILLSFILCLIIGVGYYVLSLPTTLERADDAYNTNNIETFTDIKDKLSKKEVDLFEQQLIDDASLVFESFKSNSIFHKDAIRRLESIEDYVISTSKIKEIIEQVDALNQSRLAYSEGKRWIEAKEWNNAKISFNNVIEGDPNFDSAKRYLEAISRWELQEVAALAQKYVDAKEYNLALATIEKGLLIDPTNEILLNLMDAIEAIMNESQNESEQNQSGLKNLIENGLNSLADSVETFLDNLFFWN